MSNLEKDVKKWVKKVENLTKKSVNKKILKEGAKIVQKEMKSQIKSGTKGNRKVHRRYLKDGTLAGTYHRGNLMRSIRILTFRKSKGVFVGPKLGGGKGAGNTIYKGRRVDGYYAHMINNGTSRIAGIHFKEKTHLKTKNKVAKVVGKEISKFLSLNKKKHGLG